MALDWSPKFEVMASSMRCDGVARLDPGFPADVLGGKMKRRFGVIETAIA